MLKTRPIKTNWATRNQNQKKGRKLLQKYGDAFIFCRILQVLQQTNFSKNLRYTEGFKNVKQESSLKFTHTTKQ